MIGAPLGGAVFAVAAVAPRTAPLSPSDLPYGSGVGVPQSVQAGMGPAQPTGSYRVLRPIRHPR